MDKKYVVDGFKFDTEQEAAEARNELEGIKYLEARTNFNDPHNVLAVYNKVIEKKLFKTPIGYNFLKNLRDILIESDEIDDDIINDIPVAGVSKKVKKAEKKAKAPKTVSEREEKYKNRITNLIILNVFLIVAIVVIILITNNSDNINILNYKDRLDRQYEEKENELAIWGQELKEREQSLIDMEK